MTNRSGTKFGRLRWALRIAVVGTGIGLGIAAGMGLYTFEYARGASYLTNDPKACVNCHVMTDQYEGWLKGSHRSVARCNDCHAPHDFIGKYVTKARNGFWHSYAFTTGDFHEPIQITEGNRRITEQTCRNCHRPVVEAIEGDHGNGLSCLHCHRSVGHAH